MVSVRDRASDRHQTLGDRFFLVSLLNLCQQPSVRNLDWEWGGRSVVAVLDIASMMIEFWKPLANYRIVIFIIVSVIHIPARNNLVSEMKTVRERVRQSETRHIYFNTIHKKKTKINFVDRTLQFFVRGFVKQKMFQWKKKKNFLCLDLPYSSNGFLMRLKHANIVHVRLPVFDEASVISGHHPVVVVRPHHGANGNVMCL